jgi:hypothetical protein
VEISAVLAHDSATKETAMPPGDLPPEDLLDGVVDRDSFIAFVAALADEREEAEKMERENPEAYRLGGAKNWQNGDISAFLYAALDYFTEKPFHSPEQTPSWKMFAEFLYCEKIIE